MSDGKPDKPQKLERRGLGRGLSALMADVNIAAQPDESAARGAAEQFVPVEHIQPNPEQPRRSFPREALEELAASIREKGVIQPLVVRALPGEESRYQIVAGERRWRAAQIARLHSLPVVVRELSDSEVLEVAIIENIQRADLNPVEEAAGYSQLMERFGHTQEKLAEALGKSRSHIANLLRLLQLPEEVQAHLREGRLSAGHARALITTANPAELAREVIARGLSVRQTEQLARREPGARQKQSRRSGPYRKDPDTRILEQDLSANIGMSVVIDHDPHQEGGMVTIRYKTIDQLDQLCQVLSQNR